MQNFRIGGAAAASFFCSLQLLLLRSMCVHKLNALAHSHSPAPFLSLLCLTLDRLFRRIIFIFDSALCSQRQRGSLAKSFNKNNNNATALATLAMFSICFFCCFVLYSVCRLIEFKPDAARQQKRQR